MKKRILSFSLIIALIFAMFPVTAMAADDGDWVYDNVGGAATITGYTGSDTSIMTPKTLGGLPVTVIGADAFAGNQTATDIIISEGVTEIKAGAFKNCTELNFVHIPKSTMTINTTDTFAGDYNLNKIYIYNDTVSFTPDDTNMLGDVQGPSLVGANTSTTRTYAEGLSIGFSAPWLWFDGDAFARLESGETKQLSVQKNPGECLVSWSSSNTSVATVSNSGLVTAGSTVGLAVITASCMGMEVKYYVTTTGEIKTYTDGNGDIWNYYENGGATVTIFKFNNDTRTDVTTPGVIDGMPVTTISSFAFIDKVNIQNVKISEGVTRIGDEYYNDTVILSEAFRGCTSLSNAILPSTLDSIGIQTFYESSVSSIQFTTSPTDETLISHNAVFWVEGDATHPYVLFSDKDHDNTMLELYFDKNPSITSYEIPDSVEHLGSRSFSGNDTLTSLTIPESVRELEWSIIDMQKLETVTFEGAREQIDGCINCPKLTTVNWPTGLKYIGWSAFADCGFSTIEIPASVIDISGWVFSGCGSLTSATFATGSQLTWIGQYSFSESGLTSFEIPSLVDGLDSYVFSQCADLETVTCAGNLKGIGSYSFVESGLQSFVIPSSVEFIGENAFSKCSQLEDVSFADGSILSDIGDRVFSESGLKSIEIPSSVERIGNETFSKCHDLASVTFKAGSHLKEIGDRAFAESGLTSIEIPSSVEWLSFEAFSKCPNLTSVTFEAGSHLKEFLDSVFSECGLTNIEIPTSVEKIGTEAFSKCPHLTTVTFAAGSLLQYLDERTFWESGLTSIELPSSLEYIGTEAFSSCPDLKHVTFAAGSKLKGITAYAFSESGLQSIALPSTVDMIDDGAFSKCSDLTSVTFAAGSILKAIDQGAFTESGLTSLEIPSSIEHIDKDVFSKCPDLATLTFETGSHLQDINENAFSESGLTSIEFPSSLRIIRDGAFSGCADLTTVKFNDELYQIYGSAFSHCALTSINIPRSLSGIGMEAFSDCPDLVTIKVASDNHVFKNDESDPDGHVLYEICFDEAHNPVGMNLRLFPAGWHPGSFVVPEQVSGINNGTFKNVGLNSITLHDGLLNYIGGGWTFAGNNFTRINIPESVIKIFGSYTFADNPNLKQFVVHGNNTELEWIAAEPMFDKTPNVRIYANSGSKAKDFAQAHSIPFSIIPTDLSLNQATATLKKGNTLALSANTNPVGGYVTWSSSNNAVASVDITGKVTANAVGTATITATCLDKTAACTVSVEQSSFAIAASASNASYGSVSGGGTYDEGTSVTLTASANAGYRFIRWTENGAQVSTSPKYTFTVTKAASITAEFAPLKAVDISCSKTDATVYDGANGMVTITASGGDSGTYEYSINDGSSWQASNVFSGLGAGAYTAAVRDAGYPSNIAKCSVSIGQPPHTGNVPANKVPSKANAGTAVTVVPPAAPKGATITSVSYSTTNPSVATVDAKGNVTFLTGGKVTIVTTVVSQTTDKTGKVKTKTTTLKKTITVKQPVASIALNMSNATVARKANVKLIPSIAPGTASNKKLKWTSSNPKIASVSSAGVVTGKAGGTAVITCIATDGSGVSASCTVTVTPIYPTGVKMSKAALAVKMGKSASLKATVMPKTTDFKTVTWASSNLAVATVDAKGKVTAVSPGTAVITATTSAGQVASCTVTVS